MTTPCECGTDNPQSARYRHPHLPWCRCRPFPEDVKPAPPPVAETPPAPAVDVAKLRALEQAWLNKAESMKCYVGEQDRVSALRHCASELAALLPPEETK